MASPPSLGTLSLAEFNVKFDYLKLPYPYLLMRGLKESFNFLSLSVSESNLPGFNKGLVDEAWAWATAPV